MTHPQNPANWDFDWPSTASINGVNSVAGKPICLASQETPQLVYRTVQADI